MFWFFGPQDLWAFSPLSTGQTGTPCIERQSLNHWTTREDPPRFSTLDFLKTLHHHYPLHKICDLHSMYTLYNIHLQYGSCCYYFFFCQDLLHKSVLLLLLLLSRFSYVRPYATP